MRKLVVLTLFSLFFAVSCKKATNVYDHILIHKKVNDSNYKNVPIENLYYSLLYRIHLAKDLPNVKNSLDYYEKSSLQLNDSLNIYRANNLQINLNQSLPIEYYRYKRLLDGATYFEYENKSYDAYLANYLIAEYYFNLQQFHIAENYAYKAIENLSDNNDEYAYEKCLTFILLSNIHHSQKNYDFAFKTLNNYITLSKFIDKRLISEDRLNSIKSTYINNYAIIGNKIGKISLDQTIADLKKAYKLANFNKTQFKKQKITALHNLIHFKIEANNLDSLQVYLQQFNEQKSYLLSLPIMQVKYATMGDYYLKIKKDTLAAKHFHKSILKENEEIYKNPYLEKRILEQIIQNTDSVSVDLNNHYLRVVKTIKNENNLKLNTNQKVIYENQELQRKNIKLKREIIYIVVIILSITLISLLTIYTIIQKINLKRIKLLNSYIEHDTEALEVTLTYKNGLENKLNNSNKQIFMELHDNIVNKLFSARFLLHKDYIKPDSFQVAKDTLLVVKESLQSICDNYNELNELFSKDSFHNILINLIKQQPNNKIKFDYNIDTSINWLQTTPNVRFHLYRILQELLQNIHKHSSAKTAKINILQENSLIKLIVTDNGKGFKKTAKNGLGINNINNRLKEINGHLVIKSLNGTKFIITVKI